MTAQAVELLLSVLALLTAINTSAVPIPGNIRVQAELVADQAVVVATQMIAMETDADPQPGGGGGGSTPPEAEPPQGGVGGSTEEPAEISKAEIRAVVEDPNPDNQYKVGDTVTVYIALYDDDGEIDQSSGVQMSALDPQQDKFNSFANDRLSAQDPAYYYDFTYTFRVSGEHPLKFGGNDLETTLRFIAK